MTELVVKRLCTTMALVDFDESLDIRKRVSLAITVCTAVSAGLAPKLATACKRTFPPTAIKLTATLASCRRLRRLTRVGSGVCSSTLSAADERDATDFD